MPQKMLVRTAAALTTLTWVVVVLLRGAPLDISLLASFGVVLAVVVFLMASLDRVLWRLPGVRTLFKSRVPVIRGTWKGEARSTRRDQPFDVFLVVTQTLSRVSVRMLAETGSSETLASSWGRSDDRNPTVFYLWRRHPQASAAPEADDGDPGYIQYGAGLLEVCTEGGVHLRGPYWTDERHVGDVLFESHSVKVRNSYRDAAALFEKR